MVLQAVLAGCLMYYFRHFFPTGSYMKPVAVLVKNVVQSGFLESLSSIKWICACGRGGKKAVKGLEVKSWEGMALVLLGSCIRRHRSAPVLVR